MRLGTYPHLTKIQSTTLIVIGVADYMANNEDPLHGRTISSAVGGKIKPEVPMSTTTNDQTMAVDRSISFVGISTMGVNYKQPNETAPQDRKTRQWPRQWEGRNI